MLDIDVWSRTWKYNILFTDFCDQAFMQAFKLYRMGFTANVKNKQAFEAERAALGSFRDNLDALIKEKMGKIGSMKNQLDKLENSLQNTDSALNALHPHIIKHSELMTGSCKDILASLKVRQRLRQAVVDELSFEGHVLAGAKDEAAQQAKNADLGPYLDRATLIQEVAPPDKEPLRRG